MVNKNMNNNKKKKKLINLSFTNKVYFFMIKLLRMFALRKKLFIILQLYFTVKLIEKISRSYFVHLLLLLLYIIVIFNCL